MIWAVLFTQDFPQLKGECARSISFSLLLDLYISCQQCFYVYYSNLLFSSPPLFLCFHPISENTITPAAPTAADADALNSISLHCCNVREGGREGERGERDRYSEVEGEKRENIRGWEVLVEHSGLTDSRLLPPFFLFLKDIIIGVRCSSAHHDMAWISFFASGSSRDEYILTRFNRRTGSNSQELQLELLPLRLEEV